MKQETILKKMRGKKRLEQALSLSDLVRELAVINIKEQFGVDDPSLIKEKLQERLVSG